jgi:hypothetical protein
MSEEQVFRGGGGVVAVLVNLAYSAHPQVSRDFLHDEEKAGDLIRAPPSSGHWWLY